MREKDTYFVTSVILFVEIIILITFIYFGGDMCCKKIGIALVITIVVSIILVLVIYGTNWLFQVICGYTGEVVCLSKNELHYKCNFKSAKEIYINKDVVNLHYKHFSGLKKLQYVEFYGKHTKIGRYAFYKCKNLKAVHLPEKLKEIKKETFKGCKNLTSVSIPDSVTSIGDNAFNGCSSLTSVTIPSSVTSIGAFAFGDCSSLNTVNYKGTEEQWKALKENADKNSGNEALIKLTPNYINN